MLFFQSSFSINISNESRNIKSDVVEIKYANDTITFLLLSAVNRAPTNTFNIYTKINMIWKVVCKFILYYTYGVSFSHVDYFIAIQLDVSTFRWCFLPLFRLMPSEQQSV